MRIAARIDKNHPEVVAALRAIGASVSSLAPCGHGIPDLLVGYRGINYLIEVKDGSKPPSEKKLTPQQVKWHSTWNGQKKVVETVEQAIETLTGKKK